jgi:NAD(P)-dependent dehydrogenase (short-subunit alcohol dehydrogenase family)
LKLEGKVALITGGGTGIGAAIATRFVAEGARICITGRRQEPLDKVAESLASGKVVTCSGDTSKDEDVARMVAAAVAFGGKIDILVNNAAIGASGSVGEADRAAWRKVIEVNLTGPFLLMRETIPHMIKIGAGSIINIASLAGMRCLPNTSAYCASKAGLIMLTQQAALDYGPHNIRCNAVCPGAVRTSMIEKEFGEIGKNLGYDMDAYFSMISEAMPLKRFAKPDEIGGVCTFLASDDSSFMTGAALLVDGGTAIVDALGGAITASVTRGSIQR